MSSFTGTTVNIQRSQDEVFDRIANLGAYQQYIDQLPNDIKAKIGEVRFTDDAIVITAQPVGEISLKLTRRERPSLIVFEAEGSPVPLLVNINITSDGDSSSTLTPVVEVEVPAMLRPFVAPKMQEAANQMGTMLGNLFR